MLRAQNEQRGGGPHELPLVRMVAHHQHVTGVMSCQPPADSSLRARVYLGEEGMRDDDLAYQGVPLSRLHIPSSLSYNDITAAATFPVIRALLPGAKPTRYSAPAPHGLPGGYPVRFDSGKVELDLPPGADLDELIEFHWTLTRGDGIDHIEDDGTVVFTDRAIGCRRRPGSGRASSRLTPHWSVSVACPRF